MPEELNQFSLNQFFENFILTSGINENVFIKEEITENLDRDGKPISRYKNHPSLLLINNKIKNTTPLSFSEVSLFDLEEELLILNPKMSRHYKS